jgi:hypothetical protein
VIAHRAFARRCNFRLIGKSSDLFAQQQQAKQLRAIERATSAAAGQPVRKLSWAERNLLGVRDPKPGIEEPPHTGEAARILQLEAQVAALEARVQWSIDRIQELRARVEPTTES